MLPNTTKDGQSRHIWLLLLWTILGASLRLTNLDGKPPWVYICSYITFKSLLIANLTAGMLALSPYGVFISQEARHYSLTIVWITISVTCLAIACEYLSRQQKLPIHLVITWIVVNNFGMATHYFFSFALIAQALSVGLFLLWQTRQIQTPTHSLRSGLTTARQILLHPSWQRLYITMLGSAVGVAIWFWLLSRSYDSSMTEWIKNTPHSPIEFFYPLFQTIGVLIRNLSLLFVESTHIPLVTVSRIVMLIFLIWAIPMLKRGIEQQWHQPHTQVGTLAIASFTVSTIGLYLTIPWLTGMDITRAIRNLIAPNSLPRTCQEHKLTEQAHNNNYRLFNNTSNRDKRFTQRVDGYEYQLYQCQISN